MSLNVRIITPEKVFLTSETEQVVLPSITGGLGILAGHAPLVTILEAGVLRYKNNGSWTPTVLYGGFAEVENNQVTVLVNGAEEVASSSSIEEVEKALVDATANLEKVTSFLKMFPKAQIRVECYTDSRGGSSTNFRFTQQRADAIKNHLIQQNQI